MCKSIILEGKKSQNRQANLRKLSLTSQLNSRSSEKWILKSRLQINRGRHLTTYTRKQANPCKPVQNILSPLVFVLCGVLSACLSVCYVPSEPRREHWITWKSYTELWTAMWVLAEPGSVVLLTTEPSLQALFSLFSFHIILNMHASAHGAQGHWMIPQIRITGNQLSAAWHFY